MPHRKHGLKTRVAFVPTPVFAVGFPSWPRACRRGAGVSEPGRQRPAGRRL